MYRPNDSDTFAPMVGPRRKALIDQMTSDDPNAPEQSPATPSQPPNGLIAPLPEQAPVTPPAPSNEAWVTKGYARPSYTAQKAGSALEGWDAGKWNDANHQTPKYVVGRILSEAGDLTSADNRANAIRNIQQAYPGAQFNGKDKISIDGGRSWVDIFGGASAGEYRPTWQDESAQGGASAPSASAGVLAGGIPLPAQLQGNPLDQIQQALAALQGNSPNLQALLSQLGA